MKQNKFQELFATIQGGNIDTIDTIEYDTLLNARDSEGNTSMMAACYLKDHGLAKRFVETIYSHITSFDKQTRLSFINHQNNEGNTAAHIAAMTGNIELLQRFISNKHHNLQLILIKQNLKGESPIELLKTADEAKFQEFIALNNITYKTRQELAEEKALSRVVSEQGLDNQQKESETLVAGRKIKLNDRADFVLSHKTEIENISTLLSEWFSIQITSEQVIEIVAEMLKISTSEQYLVPWLLGFQSKVTSEHLKEATFSSLRKAEKLKADELKKAQEEARLEEHLNVLINEAKGLQEEKARHDFIITHTLEHYVLAAAFKEWYGVQKSPEDIPAILNNLNAAACRHTSWLSLWRSEEPEWTHEDLIGVLGVQIAQGEVAAE